MTSGTDDRHAKQDPAARRRVLLVTRNLPPLVGGMERLNWHLADQLARRADVRAVGPAGAAGLAPPNVRVLEIPLGSLTLFLLRALWATWRTARAWRPDIVIAGSGLTAPVAWLAARACGASAAVYVHGLDMATRHPLYRALWLPAIRRMDRVVANSQATARLATDAGVSASRIAVVHPGVEIPSSPPDEGAVARFRETHGLAGGPVLLSVGRLTRRKGVREFVTDVLPAVAKTHPGVILLVAGDAPDQALRAEPQTRDSIQGAADAAGLGKHLRFLGVITDREQLATVYRTADVHVFPVQEIAGDPEGFGMVAIEAAAEGLPTVAYATGGIVDAVAPGRSGRLVAPGDSAAMARAIEDALADGETLRGSCRTFAEDFAWPRFSDAIADALGLRDPA